MPDAHAPPAAAIVHSLFFALRPDAARAERLVALASRLRTELGLRGKPRPATQLHITLQYLGRGRGGPVPELLRAARAAASELIWPAFDLGFDRLYSFARGRGPHPLVLGGGQGLEPVREMHAALADLLRRHGLRAPAGFEPHLTLLYDARVVPEQPQHVPGWVASELLLIDSLQGLGRHHVLGRWPLQA